MNTTEIWKNFSDELLGFIQSRVNDRSIAEDILQDIFVKIHQKADQLSDQDKLVSWIYQITRNTIIDYYRKKKISKSDASSLSLKEEETEVSVNPQFVKCLMPFVDQLPEKYRDALNKTMYGNSSQKEYAEEVGISYTAAKSRIQRARQKLKTLFTACCNVQTDTYGNIISSNLDNCSC